MSLWRGYVVRSSERHLNLTRKELDMLSVCGVVVDSRWRARKLKRWYSIPGEVTLYVKVCQLVRDVDLLLKVLSYDHCE